MNETRNGVGWERLERMEASGGRIYRTTKEQRRLLGGRAEEEEERDKRKKERKKNKASITSHHTANTVLLGWPQASREEEPHRLL